MIVKFLKKSFLLVSMFLLMHGLFAQNNKTRLDNIAEKIQLLEKKINARKSENQNLIDWDGSNNLQVENINQTVTDDSSANNKQTLLTANPTHTIQKSSNEDDWYSSDAFDIKEDPLNQVSVALSLVSPNDSNTNKGSTIGFRAGVDFALEYSRYFADDSYIGGGFSYKSFEANSLGGPLANTSTVSGDCSLFSFFGTLGQKWSLSERLSILTQASAGFASSNYDLILTDKKYSDAFPKAVSDTSFYYSLLLGLEYQFTRNWSAALFYELDGRSEVENLDYQSFHQFGVKTSFGF